MATSFSPRKSGGFGAAIVKRFAALGICSALTLAAAAMLFTPRATAQQTGVLSGKDIAEMYKPGVVEVETAWTANATVPQWALPPESVKALETVAEREVKAGTITGSEQDILAAMIGELAKNPFSYLVATNEPDPAVKNPLGVLATGSGFIITPDGYIVTNEHVVAQTDEVNNLFVTTLMQQLTDVDLADLEKSLNNTNLTLTDDEKKDYTQAMTAYYTKYAQLSVQPRAVTAQIGIAIPGLPTVSKGVVCDVRKEGEVTPGKDVAVLKIELTDLPTVPVGDDTKLETGDQIYVIGFPAAADMPSNPTGVEPTLTAGVISARKTMPGGWQALQTDAAINHGNSGGPAFNDEGQVIGIATWGPSDTDAQGIKFLVPMSIADQYLNELNIKPQESDLSKKYIQALSDFHSGKCTTALKEFEQIKELNPGFPYVQDYISQSTSCKEASPTFPMMYVIIGGVALILIIAVAAFALMKKKPAPAMAGAGAATMSMPMGGGAQPTMTAGAPPPGMPGAYGGAAPMGALPPRSYGSLQCTSGSAAGRRFEITKSGLLIGRDSAKCQVVLTDDAVSKEHAWIVPVEEGVMVIDRGSTNGVFVNSVDAPKVSKVKLQHGDKIYIGKGTAVFTYLSS